MKYREPKTKSGRPLLGVTISYNPNNSIIRRWFINGEAAPVAKIANMLGYPSKDSLHHAIKKYGIQLIMLKGLDACKQNN